MPEPLLVDVSCLCDHHTDGALEFIYKAGTEPPDDSIWDDHPSPLIRRLVEVFTQRGLTRLSEFQAELRKWLAGDMHVAGAGPARPAGAMGRWTAREVGAVKVYLEHLMPSEFRLDDWMLVIDYLVQRYLPADDLRTDASWLATRANVLGRVQAAMGSVEGSPEQGERIMLAMGKPVGEAIAHSGLTSEQLAVIEFGRARCAEAVVGLSDAVRHRMRRLIVDHHESMYFNRGREAVMHGADLHGKLLDEFGTLNRDWRRIAVTESTTNFGNGVIAALPPGSRVRRVEQYRGACSFCRSIDGKIYNVVAPDDPKRDELTDFWVGKSNIGRSASPRKRVAGALVERDPHEMWVPVPGAVHPNCRGRNVPIEAPRAKVDPEFSAWMDEVLRRK